MRKMWARKGMFAVALCAPTAGLIVLFLVTRGASAEVATPDSSAVTPAAIGEPTTAGPSTPLRGNETPMRDPFAPADSGPPEGRWEYATSPANQRAEMDQERAANQRVNWAATHNEYANALSEQAKQAAATAAAQQLGVENLATLGVVP